MNITLGELIKELGGERVDSFIDIPQNYAIDNLMGQVESLDIGSHLKNVMIDMARNIDMLNSQVIDSKISLSKLNYIIENYDCDVNFLPTEYKNNYVYISHLELEREYKKHRLTEYINNI